MTEEKVVVEGEVTFSPGEIAYLKLSGEPVTILGPYKQQDGDFPQEFADYVVRRYSVSRDLGSQYILNYFTAAELVRVNPMSPEDMFSKLLASGAINKDTPIEIIPLPAPSEPTAKN